MIRIVIFFIFSFIFTSPSLNIDHSGYTNVYAINRISDASIIKVPFRLLSYDFNIDYKQFGISSKFGIEHKIQNFDSNAPLSNIMYNLISNNNVDYKTEFRELYLSFFPSFGELKFGKQLHSWGSVDINSPLDILNPTDYYYLFTDSDETKIGRESIVLDLYIKSLKMEFIVMNDHIPNNIPTSDPDFPITLPAAAKDYQFLDLDNPIEYGAYIQNSFSNMDLAAYYFSGYDRTFNLYGANVFSDDSDVNTLTDTIFSYRKTNMYGLSNVTFIGDLTLRADLAYFETDAGDDSIESRPYSGQDLLSNYLDFNTLLSSTYFDVSAKYYQYCIQLEYPLPFDIDFTTQLFGYETLEVNGNFVDIDIPNFEISLDATDLFFPGMGSSMSTLCKNGLVLNFTKTIMDDMLELQFTNLLDLKDKGRLTQFQLSYDISDNINLSFLFYKGKGNADKYPDIIETEDFNESLLYPFNAMEDFSHIRAQLQYFF